MFFSERSQSHTLYVLAALEQASQEQASQEELDGRVLELHKSGSPRKKRWFLCSTLSIKLLTSVQELQALSAGAHFSSLIGCRHGSEPALGACLISYRSSKPISEFALVRSNRKTSS